ncbi:MAG: hypothetical protein J5674_01470 [Candidatus Methanomethylophilaceae archaeon]|nr:hypothetical protein [Candidatus Methanomethylophilaceae archaeon]
MTPLGEMALEVERAGLQPRMIDGDDFAFWFTYQMVTIICYYDREDSVVGFANVSAEAVPEGNRAEILSLCNRINRVSGCGNCYIMPCGNLVMQYRNRIRRKGDFRRLLGEALESISGMKREFLLAAMEKKALDKDTYFKK